MDVPFALVINTLLHAAFGWRIHGGVEDTELSTNKQLSLCYGCSLCISNKHPITKQVYETKISCNDQLEN